MLKSIKNKRGIEAGGLSLVIGLIILILSAVVILLVLMNSASKATEITQVDLCRASNEVRVWSDAHTAPAIEVFAPESPLICPTIDKTSGSSKVPTDLYAQDQLGAQREIADMLTKCWWMWLEGTQTDMFNNLPSPPYPEDPYCQVCYKFRIKNEEEFKEITFNTLIDTMSQPYKARDGSNKCSQGGGFLSADCDSFEHDALNLPPYYDSEDDEWREHTAPSPVKWRVTPSKEALSLNLQCCIRMDAPNECENRGGRCCENDCEGDDTTHEGKEPIGPTGYPKYYPKWSCPKANQKCWVKGDQIYSYAQYIASYGGVGSIVLNPPPDDGPPDLLGDVAYPLEEIYAISIVSPPPEEDFWDRFVNNLLPTGDLAFILDWAGAHSWSKVVLIGEEQQNNFILFSTYEDAILNSRHNCVEG